MLKTEKNKRIIYLHLSQRLIIFSNETSIYKHCVSVTHSKGCQVPHPFGKSVGEPDYGSMRCHNNQKKTDR